MQTTSVRVNPIPPSSGETSEAGSQRLRASASIVLGGVFAVRDLKLIEGERGLHVVMPSRPLCDRCPSCNAKTPLRHRYCHACGKRLGDMRATRDEAGRVQLYTDVAHPIVPSCRQDIHDAVVSTYEEQLRLGAGGANINQ